MGSFGPEISQLPFTAHGASPSLSERLLICASECERAESRVIPFGALWGESGGAGALHAASRSESAELVLALLVLGADIHSRAYNGRDVAASAVAGVFAGSLALLVCGAFCPRQFDSHKCAQALDDVDSHCFSRRKLCCDRLGRKYLRWRIAVDYSLPV